MTPNEIDFMEKLVKLTQETGVAIGGCGCCGSPRLFAKPEGEGYYTTDGAEIEWVKAEYAENLLKRKLATGDRFFKA